MHVDLHHSMKALEHLEDTWWPQCLPSSDVRTAAKERTLCHGSAEVLRLPLQGVVELVSDFTVCKAGDALTPNQAALLRVFEIKQAAFHITPICRWQAEGQHPHHGRHPQCSELMSQDTRSCA